MLGGVLWLILWVHFLLTHGPTSRDYRETFFGLSYYDSTKLVVFALAFCIVGIVSLRVRLTRETGRRAGALGFYLALVGLAGIIVGVAADVWPVAWGDTAKVSTGLTGYVWGGIAIASLTALVGTTLMWIGAARTKIVSAWTIAPLVLAGLATIPWLHHTLHGVVIGLGWLAVGYALWRTGISPAVQSSAWVFDLRPARIQRD
jgi:hypothetical protein